MSKHTPGPWTVGEDGDVIWGARWKGAITHVATVPFSKDPRVSADARLIAAAPDLLAALEMVRDADNDCRDDGLPCIPAMARGAIDGAIAKATQP